MDHKLLLTLAAIFMMGLITYLLRAFPTLVPERLLQSPILRTFNYALPMSVMMVLILASLGIINSSGGVTWSAVIAKAMALLIVLLSYIRFRNVFVSVIIGVASVNGFLYLFDNMLFF